MNIRGIGIQTARFIVRPLIVSDASQKYLDWMNDDVVARYIAGASDTLSLASLESYILEKTLKKDCIFLGIFDNVNGKHIGNIKYEPICLDKKEAVMGVLLGDSSWRGKHVFSEVFIATKEFLAKTYSIKTIRLGVDKSNTPAIKAYQKVGFIAQPVSSVEPTSSIEMIYEC